ncbi:MAG: hypothetical protein JNM84_25165 [Planctomycetes bacterium]|nr:hypothetical protein [Planctomycetota bacterium]
MPLLVEAAEELFHPVAIRNNVEGYEDEVRKRFGEPAWNNPVVRFLGGDAQDVLERKDGVWERGALIARMCAALRAAQREVPPWLRTLERETAAGAVETALFAMT